MRNIISHYIEIDIFFFSLKIIFIYVIMNDLSCICNEIMSNGLANIFSIE